eukprot:89357_1
MGNTQVSLLSLCCPGTGGKGVGKQVAVKSNGKINDIKNGANKISAAIHLNGVDEDNSTINKWMRSEPLFQDKKTNAYKSKQSRCDATIKIKGAKKRVKAWLNEENVGYHIFYFSGHGTKANGGGICFQDGALTYADFAKTIKENHDGKSYIILIIDACFSGLIHKAFKDMKYVTLCWACAGDQVASDQGLKGGYFTQTYFKSGKSLNNYFKNGFKPIPQNYANGTSSFQTPGGLKKL